MALTPKDIKANEESITLKEFLEKIPPGRRVKVKEVMKWPSGSQQYLVPCSSFIAMSPLAKYPVLRGRRDSVRSPPANQLITF